MIEIERKFLVRSDAYKKEAFEQNRISQGYLNSDPERTVRVRIKGKQAFLTIKGKSSENGISRYEWETEVPFGEAEELMKICLPEIIEKNRFLVHSGEHVFEVDEFLGANEGLTIAEIELSAEDSEFIKPEWLGEEVTGDKRYYNSYLSKIPYTQWNKGS